MRADNLRWTPVRLESRRLSNNCYEILRDGEPRGRVERLHGRWHSRQPICGSYAQGHLTKHASWGGAVLRLARYPGIHTSSDGPQDYGLVRMIRVNVASRWYSVIEDGESLYLYDDFTIRDRPEGIEQALLRRLLSTAEGYLRDHPVRTKRAG